MPRRPPRDAEIVDVAAELRGEAPRKPLDQRIAIRVRADRGKCGAIGNVVHDSHNRAVSGAVYGKVRDLDRGRSIHDRTAEHAAPGVGIPKVETAFHLALGPVAECIGFATVAEIEAEVAEQLEVAGDLGCAPDLRCRLADVVVAGVDQTLGITALGTAAGGIGLFELEAQVGESEVRERQADVGGYCHGAAVAFEVGSPLAFDGGALGILLEYEVHDSGDGVGPVLGRCTVPEYLEAVQGDGRYRRQVGALGPAGDSGAEERDDRRPVTTLAVDENQRGIRGKRSQGRRANERRGVADRLLGDVVRRH